MIFNSIAFCIFFIVVFLIYYFPLKTKTKAQNWLLLLSSYFFYGYADWRMTPVLLVSTVVIYILGIAVHKTSDPKKSSLLTTAAVITGVGLLVYFKYFNFFIDSFSALLNGIGLNFNIGGLTIIMPLGISYFTFKLISYIIEINRGRIEPSKDFVSFSTYIAFFPTILSGPIDRPNMFLPQLENKRVFNYQLVVDGCRQILWGLFQKVLIADSLARTIDAVWKDVPNANGSLLFIIAILYSFQLYTDFSGYSHMAIGVGKLLGFRITKNFNYPFFSRNIAEFWQKWHMSLTSWLTEYVFMPLNIKFRNYGQWGIILAIVINMLAVGLWHGANWTFFIFGLYHGLLFIPLIISGAFFKKKKLKTNQLGFPSLSDFFKIISTFMLFTVSLIIFRAPEIDIAWLYFKGIFDESFFSLNFEGVGLSYTITPILFLLFLLIIEWMYKDSEYAFDKLFEKWKRPFRWLFYMIIIFLIGMLMPSEESPFIYFQF